MLKGPEHLESFHHFLMSQGNNAEMQLLFWVAVENMKSSMSNRKTYRKTCNSKMRRIQQRFFSGGAEKGTCKIVITP